MKQTNVTTTSAAALMMAGAMCAFAAEPEAPAAAAEPSPNFFTETLPDAVMKGKFLLNVRARYEHVDQDGARTAHAPTVRTRLGYQTADIYGFQGLLEMEDVTILGSGNNYSQGGLNPRGAGHATVLDPDGTEVNRAWLSYSNWDTTVKLGRQRIILDNWRFVGNVGWRQNEQTYDAVSLKNTTVDDLTVFYSYINNVNRVVGDDHPAGNYHSDSHVVNATYSGLPVKLTGYGYFLNLEGGPDSDTYGIFATGKHAIDEQSSINYRAEFAYQEGGDADYEAEYYHLSLGGDCRGYTAGVGYEVLGTDNGVGFATPLATLHAFNGWADVFLNTPGNGLRDLYGWLGAKLPYEMPAKVVFHSFESDSGGVDYGYELDAIVSKSFGKNWTALAKYAYYDGDGGFATRQKIWAEVTFNF